MAEKPDHYQVLGVAKTATADDIKKAYKRIAFSCHPDGVVRTKGEAEKKAAEEKFKQATEAEKVLSDPSLRAAYDKFGHKGVENMLAGNKSSSGGQGPATATPRPTFSADDAFDFFDRRREQQERVAPKPASPGETAEQRRARAAEERRKSREPRKDDAPTTPAQKDSPGDDFKDVAGKVDEAVSRLRDGDVALPLDALQRFRRNLQDFLGEVDKAIDRAKKRDSGFKP